MTFFLKQNLTGLALLVVFSANMCNMYNIFKFANCAGISSGYKPQSFSND